MSLGSELDIKKGALRKITSCSKIVFFFEIANLNLSDSAFNYTCLDRLDIFVGGVKVFKLNENCTNHSGLTGMVS